MELADGRPLGDLPLAAWTPPLVQRWQDRRGRDAPVTCNREKSYMARVFAWGLARGHVTDNPVRAVPRITEHARTRYVTDREYTEALERAAASGTPYLVPIMELAYLLRARLAEVLDLQRTHCDPDGILLHRRKGSRDAHTSWSPRLRAAVDAALSLHGKIASRYLIPSADHGRMRESTVQTAWQRMMVDWAEEGRERFRIHDLKAKGITDTKEGDKLAASGHRDPRMLAIYDRLPGKVPSTR